MTAYQDSARRRPGRDMGINFTVNALRAIFNTFSLSEIRSLSLKQDYIKTLASLYEMVLSLPQAKVREQIVIFVKGLLKKIRIRLAPEHPRPERPAAKDRQKINKNSLIGKKATIGYDDEQLA